LLPHVLIVTVPLLAGVNVYHTPLPKLLWQVGAESPVEVAFAVLSIRVTPLERAIALLH
jgi:hypothetical protein